MVATTTQVEISAHLQNIYNFNPADITDFCKKNGLVGFQVAIEESIGIMPIEFYEFILWFHSLPNQTPKFIGIGDDKKQFEKQFGQNSYEKYDGILHAVVKAQAVYQTVSQLTVRYFGWVLMHLGCNCGCCKIIVSSEYKVLEGPPTTVKYKQDSFIKNLEEEVSKMM